ncbi:phage holin [Psychrobacillus sp. BM2]|uniref:phage holin n=1 Tax=Psychrobacillus sp. BM2 TaxID=3400421 RepID=UPI003B0126B8
MKINWKVRLLSYPFWVALFGFIGLIVNNSGLIDLAEYNNYVDAFMLVLLAGGVVADPTTQGLSDSKKALTYDRPKKD